MDHLCVLFFFHTRAVTHVFLSYIKNKKTGKSKYENKGKVVVIVILKFYSAKQQSRGNQLIRSVYQHLSVTHVALVI